ncbi:head-tail connector protein [Bacillus sp. FJAT-45350]|uniref:head-tail connector protein n=1 Tax=Bacillus sp. FJAT-45350 TaxID=2011014 RepID=UPI000BB763E2|nr:head-tail connector protein [Bacillus sp. FJAT-45350]
MTVQQIFQEEIKQFLRIDGEEDNNLVTSLIVAAEVYIKNATRPDVDTTLELYKTAVKLLVSNWYENREPIGKATTLAFSLESILIQLSHCGSDINESGKT